MSGEARKCGCQAVIQESEGEDNQNLFSVATLIFPQRKRHFPTNKIFEFLYIVYIFSL